MVARPRSHLDVRLLQTGDAALVALIRDEITTRGPVTFARFMEQALYHPAHGYYSSGRCTIGRRGDYFTNVSVGPLFGQLMAAQFAEMWEALGRPHEFTVVEQGAHGGEFAADVLKATRAHHPRFFESLRYQIVEPFPALRERQVAALSEFAGKLTWHESLAEMPAFRGVHFSNELLDAMPVHLLRWTGSEWMERHVALHGTDFLFVDLPITDASLGQRVTRLPIDLPVGYETEINLGALEWIDALARKLNDGFVLAVDYGWSRDEFYAPHRTTGTLRCYAQHRIVPSPLEQIGHADITAHVEWTSLAEKAGQAGFEIRGFTDQHHFITGLLAGPVQEQLSSAFDAKTARQLQTLLQPSHLGMKFQYLVLANGDDAVAAKLSGLRFASNPQQSLSLTLSS
jgi:SAM-dependent MidA family methyltransferase